MVRLNGNLETYKFAIIKNTAQIKKLNLIKAHQKPVIRLVCTPFLFITTSYDCTIKIFEILTMRIIHMLTAHNSPVIWICVDEETNVFLFKNILIKIFFRNCLAVVKVV